MKKLEENLEKNMQLSDEFKQLAKQSFKEMFEMLGREGFKKWVKLQTISKDVKSLIYEWADNEEMGFRVGDYNPAKNKIRIRKSITSPKEIIGVSKHEDFHFFTRNGDLHYISTYLNEGATEYLKHLSEENDEGYSYEENVEVVKFLREFIGDSIIQTYLEGKKEYFFSDLDDILSQEIKAEEEREEEIYKFMDALDERHYYLYSYLYVNKDDYENGGAENVATDYDEDDSIENASQYINDFFRKIIICKFRKMAKDRVFNRNGCVDEELAKEIINEKLKNARFVGEEYDWLEQSEIASYVLEEMINKIILEIENNYNSKSKIMFDCEFEKRFQKMLGEERYSMNEVFRNIFEGKTQMSIIEFSDYITKLASEFNIPQNELKALCENHAFKCFENGRKVEEVYELIVNNIPRNKAVFNFLAKEITSTEPQFRKIGDSEYVEKRDGQFVYIKINDDGTICEESDLSKVKDIFKINDSFDSIRLVNREDDYRELGVLNEKEFQQVEMVHLMINQIIYQKDVNFEDVVNKMNIIIEDSQFLSKLTEVALHKRTRLQVIDLINVLTKEEIEYVSNEIYDKALMDSGIKDIEQNQELREYYRRLYDYENNKKDNSR